MNPQLDRFQPPSVQEQQSWILCESCNDAQAEVQKNNKLICADCAQKEQEDATTSNT